MNAPQHFSRQGSFVFNMEVVQQPVRARMCGLGDKDRRQISPPAFIKLHIFDAATGRPIDADHADIASLVMVVELWSTDEKVDLTLNQNVDLEYSSSPEVSPHDSPTSQFRQAHESNTNQPLREGHHEEEHPHASSDSDESLGDIPTRNLIGSVVVNGAKLYDENHERGVWFILSDLSVRIEGDFKLKFKLVDLATNTSVDKFSQPFKVYSAKKFPGVVDSIGLGRVFASQGVKIQIRREVKDPVILHE